MKRKQVQLKVTTVGEPDICKLSESEQKAFYVSMLMRILDNRDSNLKNNPQMSIIAKQQVDICKTVILTLRCAKLCSH